MNDTPTDLVPPNRRILVVDDNPAIHDDMRKVLHRAAQDESQLVAQEAQLFGGNSSPGDLDAGFELDFALQGQEALAKVIAATAAGRPFALAFVDVRMPPGWDGIETIQHLWKTDPQLQVVVCTAYSDYSWEEMTRCLGESDNLLILKKPFDNIEVVQLAHALSRKWRLTRQAELSRQELDRLVRQRTAELHATNRQLTGEIAQRQQMEKELLRVQRLESVGHLAGGIAHEFNNLHTIVQGFAELCLNEVSPQQPALKTNLRNITAASTRATALIKELMAFSQQLTLWRTPLEPYAVLEKVRRTVEATLPPGVTLVLERTPGLPLIYADADALERVVVNLCLQARDVVSDQGHIVIRTRDLAAAERAAAATATGNPAADYVCIEVSDSNPAPDLAAADRMFDPFASMKSLTQGTGLRLASAYGLIRQHEGWINVTAEAGRGTTFLTYWPVALPPARLPAGT